MDQEQAHAEPQNAKPQQNLPNEDPHLTLAKSFVAERIDEDEASLIASYRKFIEENPRVPIGFLNAARKSIFDEEIGKSGRARQMELRTKNKSHEIAFRTVRSRPEVEEQEPTQATPPPPRALPVQQTLQSAPRSVEPPPSSPGDRAHSHIDVKTTPVLSTQPSMPISSPPPPPPPRPSFVPETTSGASPLAAPPDDLTHFQQMFSEVAQHVIAGEYTHDSVDTFQQMIPNPDMQTAFNAFRNSPNSNALEVKELERLVSLIIRGVRDDDEQSAREWIASFPKIERATALSEAELQKAYAQTPMVRAELLDAAKELGIFQQDKWIPASIIFEPSDKTFAVCFKGPGGSLLRRDVKEDTLGASSNVEADFGEVGGAAVGDLEYLFAAAEAARTSGSQLRMDGEVNFISEKDNNGNDIPGGIFFRRLLERGLSVPRLVTLVGPQHTAPGRITTSERDPDKPPKHALEEGELPPAKRQQTQTSALVPPRSVRNTSPPANIIGRSPAPNTDRDRFHGQ